MEYKCDEGEDQFDTELDEGPDHLGPRHPLKRLVRCLQVSPGEERQKGGQSTVQEPTGEAQRLQHSVQDRDINLYSVRRQTDCE